MFLALSVLSLKSISKNLKRRKVYFSSAGDNTAQPVFSVHLVTALLQTIWYLLEHVNLGHTLRPVTSTPEETFRQVLQEVCLRMANVTLFEKTDKNGEGNKSPLAVEWINAVHSCS